MLGRMDQVHAEYRIPGILIPIDLLDSISGEIWEIKPWDKQAQARLDLKKRILGMNQAKGLLSGMNPVGMSYNWKFHPHVWISGLSFPSTDVYIGTDDSGWFDIYAKQTEPGVIAWWKHLRRSPEQVPYPIVLPDEVTWSQRNRRLGWQPAFVPVPAYGGIPYPLQGREPLFQPGFGKGCAIPFDGIEIDPLTGVVIVGGSYVLGNIIWWLGKVLAPLCGPAAPVCLIIL